MYVCICQAITERQVREAAQQGVSNLRGLRQHLGVASECGRCAKCAHNILKECHGCGGCERSQQIFAEAA
jgi:bacterioferritin-associated ferredoxin